MDLHQPRDSGSGRGSGRDGLSCATVTQCWPRKPTISIWSSIWLSKWSPLWVLILAVSLSFSEAATAASEPIVLTDNLTSLEIGNKLDLLEDAAGKLDIDDVVNGQVAKSFKRSEKMKPNFGFTRSAYWLRFSLHNPQDRPRNLLLELAYSAMDQMTFYRERAPGQFDTETLGDQIPFEKRKIPNRNPVFELQVPAHSTQTFYARLQTEGSMQIPLTLHEPIVFFKMDHNSQIAFGLYFGIVLVMGLYNLFLFLAVRDKTYIYYVLFISGVSFFNMTLSGLAYEYFLKNFPFLANKSIALFILVIGGPGCLFTMSFLRTREIVPRLHKFLVGFAVFFGVMVLPTIFGPYSVIIKVLALVTVTWGFVLTGTGIYVLSKGYRPARFYVLAWVALLSGCIMQAARLLGFLPSNFITEYGMEIGSALEVILLSLALADRITIMKQEKEIAQKQAIESFKKADQIKNDFLANTSHELRTPLNGIIGIAESLMDGVAGALNRTARENLGMIVSAGQRLSSLVNDILDFSKLRNHNLELQLKPVALKQLVDVEIALLRPLVGTKDLELVNEIPEELKAVLADENRLIQILQNVIGNAIKFTEKGRVTLQATDQGEMIELRVIDTGIGIPHDKLDQVFIAFEQGDGSTAREFGGTGIGLSITKQLVELHHGTITIESEVGQGTTMIIELPASPETAESADASAKLDYIARTVDIEPEIIESPEDVETAHFYSESGLHILVVDDEPLNLKVLTNQLSLHGHKVSLGHDGAEALRIIEEEGKPDLVLLDVMMPKITGLEVCQRVREKYSATELPVILLTAKNQLRDLLSGFSVGANDYLTKPFSSQEVLARIKVHAQVSNFAIALAHANEELRIQIAKRSEQLFSTLAMIAQGARQIESLEPGKVIGGRYQIKNFVGEGGMGSVYEVTVLSNEERAALKIAKSGDPFALAQLAQEARMAVEVLHENIVRVIDVDVANEGFLYVVMEYLDGQPLSEVEERFGDVNWGLKVLWQICSGLSELHGHNLVHRDLKPGNLIITNGNRGGNFNLKIVDFGISSWEAAQNLERISTIPETTDSRLPYPPGTPDFPAFPNENMEVLRPVSLPPEASDMLELPPDFPLGDSTVPPAPGSEMAWGGPQPAAGTPRFMAPEQIQDGAPASKSTDIWAVGVIAHRILTKGWPMDDESLSDFLTGFGQPQIKSITQSSPDLDPNVAGAIDACLNLNPSMRPTARELAEIISKVVTP